MKQIITFILVIVGLTIQAISSRHNNAKHVKEDNNGSC